MYSKDAAISDARHKYIKLSPHLPLKDIKMKAEGNRAICLNLVGVKSPACGASELPCRDGL